MLLAELQDETKLVLRDLRDLAQGIHPTVLIDRGLVEAVEDRIARMPGLVRLEVAGPLRGARFPPDVEGERTSPCAKARRTPSSTARRGRSSGSKGLAGAQKAPIQVLPIEASHR